jgi:ADP-heptose:LPS heptosyltransferase
VRILLSRTDRIGDLILSTPAIASVRASFPDAHVTMVTSKYNQIAMERNDDVDDLIALDGPVQRANVLRNLRGFDVAIALAPRAADLQIVGATRAKRRIGYTYMRRWVARLTAPLFVTKMMVSEADPALCERNPHFPVRHEVEQLLDLVTLAGANERVTHLRLDLRDEDRDATRRLPANPVVLHLGERWFRDGSTLASTQQLLSDLSGLGHPIVVTVPPESERYAAALDAPENCRVLGVLPFFEWAAVFEHAACVVTVDTAATHVASAMRRPTVVAFEHRYFELNSQEWAPYGVPSVLIRKPASESSEVLKEFRKAVVDGVKRLIRT